MKVITDTNGKVLMSESGVFEVPQATIVTHPAPTISVNSSTGLITASHTQDSGEVEGGTTTATQQLTTQGAQTITPTTSDQTIAAGKYLTGAQTVKGDANLIAANIASGVTIFGVTGTHSGGGGGGGVLVHMEQPNGSLQGYYLTTDGVATPLPFDPMLLVSEFTCMAGSFIYCYCDMSTLWNVTGATIISSQAVGRPVTYYILLQANAQ